MFWEEKASQYKLQCGFPDCIFVPNLFSPRQVRHSPTVGRYLVAARDIEPLELVLWDRWVANC